MKNFEEESSEMAQVQPMNYNDNFELPNLVQVVDSGNAKIMTESAFEQFMVNAVNEANNQLDSGVRGKPAKEVFSKLRKKYGLSEV